MMPTTTRLAALAKTARGYIAAGYASLPHLKSTTHAPYIRMETLADPVWAPRDYAAFAREGMMQNAVLYRCVRMIAECAASVPLLLYDGDTEITDHPFLTLLSAPAPGQTRTDLLEAYYGFLLVAGNSYLEAVPAGGRIRELHTLRPDRMRIVPGLDGWPDGYEYSVNGQISRLIGEAVPGVSRVLHSKLFHPANDHYGLSPIEAAATSVDIHNEASKWNKALLDNSARPSGALVYGNGQSMTAAQFERLKSELEETYAGARNAGRPMLLEGGLDWKAMSLSPRDMDFIALKQMAAREIALALGVPPMLLGIPGDNTYANYTEANRVFWRQTVIPLVQRTASGLSRWLGPAFGRGLVLRPDLDSLDALTGDRDAQWTRLQATTFLTDDEKRALVGYGPKPEAMAHKYSPDQPRDELGRWEDGGGFGGKIPREVANPGADGEKPVREAAGGRGKPPSMAPGKPTPKPPSMGKPDQPTPNPNNATIRNKELAGKNHPITGIPFDKEGYPDFSGVTKATANFPLAGNNTTDFSEANRQNGFKETPENMTWHHHQNGRQMQLVPYGIHRSTGHTGPIGTGNLPGR
jgi:HK97 family phage portal protein